MAGTDEQLSFSVSGPSNRRGVSAREEIDRICDAFESAWRSGSRPRLEDFLSCTAHDAVRNQLLRELLLLDLDYLLRNHAPINISDLYRRFPTHESLIAEVCQSVASGPTSSLSRKDATSELPLPFTLGCFDLLEIAGCGTWSHVYRARDRRLNRTVAVKMFRCGSPELHGSDEWLLREARHVGRLSHRGIVPVYEMGRSAFGAYIVMEYVCGPTLAEVLATSSRLEFRQAASLLAEVAEAVHYAHSRGVIHRDLKPANIIIDAASDRSSSSSAITHPAPSLDGMPRVLDFGLARRVDTASIAYPGAVVGTPAYMSPEQARGDSKIVDHRSDIYSLGAILFQICAGRPRAADSQEENVTTRSTDCTAQTTPESIMPDDLAAICTKCLDTEPSLRYQSAKEIAEDLRRWLTGYPVTARPASMVRRALCWCRRHKRLSLATTVFAVLLCASLAIGVKERYRSNEFRSDMHGAQVRQLLSARGDDLPVAIRMARTSLAGSDVNDLLSRLDNLTARQKSLVRLATLPDHLEHATGLIDELMSWDAHEFRAIVEAFKPAERILSDHALAILTADTKDSSKFLRAACAAALTAPSRFPREHNIIADLLDFLVIQPEDELQEWATALRPVAETLRKSLAERIRNHSNQDDRVLTGTCRALAILSPYDVEALTSSIRYSNTDGHRILVNALSRSRPSAIDALRNITSQIPTGAHPDISVTDALIHGRASAVIALLELEPGAHHWSFWSNHADPRLQTYLIHESSPRRLPPVLLTTALRRESDPGIQYALLLALGTYTNDLFPASMREETLPWLTSQYLVNPSAGVHSAIAWLLKKWGYQDELKTLDKKLRNTLPSRTRNWYHNSLDQTMIILPQDHQGTLTAIAAAETSWTEFQSLFPDRTRLPKVALDDECPVTMVSWFDATEFCRRLSVKEGLHPALGSAESKASTNLEIPSTQNSPVKSGYRLPSLREWTQACRASSATDRFFGAMSTPYASQYAWFNRPTGTTPVGQLMPNQWGFFDIYGNAHEWTAEFTRPATDRQRATVYFMGGSFYQLEKHMHSSCEALTLTHVRRDDITFRVAKTIQ